MILFFSVSVNNRKNVVVRQGLGWRLDADFASGDDLRVIQFTPPGSGCSVIFGKNVTPATPGSAQGLYLIVSDIAAARAELLDHVITISEVFHAGDNGFCSSNQPYLFGQRRVRGTESRTSQLPLVRLLPRSRRQRLAAAGDHDAAARPHRFCRDFVLHQ